MNNYDRYKALKEKFDFVYEGICLNRVLALPIWGIANSTYTFSWKRVALAFLAIDVRKMQFDSRKHAILSTFGRYARKDHLELYDAVMERLGEEVACNNSLTFGWKLSIHPILSWKICRFTFTHLRDTSLSLRDKWKLIIECIHYCNIIEELKCMDFSGVQRYLCQCNVLDLENLLTQFFKLKHIPTYSLQEGVYFLMKANPPLDVIQYENFETDNLMSWGQFSIDEFISYGISSHRLCLAGYPKKVERHDVKRENMYKKCMVLLARDSFRDTNMRLLYILLKHSSDYDFCLKLHPACDYVYYSSFASQQEMMIVPKEKTINECLDNSLFDFAIAVNTTTYYEALMRGLPCLRFCDGTFDLMAGYKDVFGTDEEFQEVMAMLKTQSSVSYQHDIEQVLEYAIGMGIDNYKKIICG